jgi:hypothetical protein
VKALALAAMLALASFAAGCGGSSSSTATTTGAVAGARTTQQFLDPTFAGSVNSIARQISASVAAVHDHPEAVGSATGTLTGGCKGTVATQLTQRAQGAREKAAARGLDAACVELIRATKRARVGDLAQAKRLATRALAHAKQAVAAVR